MAASLESGSFFDLLIRRGLIIDGTGAPARLADIGIRGDRIAAVGDLSLSAAHVVIDAAGLRAAPGFIDIHTHSDISALYEPGQLSAVAMGVTTQVVGNCGLGPGFAVDTPLFDMERRYLFPGGGRIPWRSFGEHLQLVRDTGCGTNLIALAGHGTLRKRIVGMEDRPATPVELREMRELLDDALAAGAWGLSSGLEYPPSAFADSRELIFLCESVRVAGGFYATHMRNEGDTLLEAVAEAIGVAEGAGVPLQISHHKAEGRGNWGKVHQTLPMIDAARTRGVDVQLDQYPYTAFMTSLGVQALPRWAMSGSSSDMLARLRDPEMRSRVAAEMREAHPDWADVTDDGPLGLLRVGVCRRRPELQGSTIAALSRAACVDPVDYILDLILSVMGEVSAVNFAICEEDIATIMRYEWTSIGSDGVGTRPDGRASADLVHPRSYGSFARVLGRYVRDLGVLTEEQAVHKMTGLNARRLRIPDRGTIAVGAYADITLYRLEAVHDAATFARPHRFAEGIEAVIINGTVALLNGAPKNTLSGRVLSLADYRRSA